MAVSTLTNVVDDVSTSNQILQNQRVIDMDNTIKILEPDAAPLFTMLSQTNSRPAQSSKVEWIEDELLPRVTSLTATLNNSDTTTTVGVTSGTESYFRAGDLIRVAETGEQCLVTSIDTSGHTITITRGYGATVHTTTTQNCDIVRLGNAATEGDTLGPITMTKKVAKSNFCQIFRNPFGVTNTLLASNLYGASDEIAYQAKKVGIEHKASLELQAFFGSKKQDVAVNTASNVTLGAAASHARSTMGGIVDFISTNNTTVAAGGAALTTANFETFLRSAFRYDSGANKVFFCSPLIVSAISGFPLGRLAPPDPNIKMYGCAISRYQSAQGQSFPVVVKRDWYDYASTRTGSVRQGYGGFGVMVDLDNLVYRPLRTTVLKPNRQIPSEDSTIQEWFTEASLQVVHERTHATIDAVTG
jgi:hypothetical protein